MSRSRICNLFRVATPSRPAPRLTPQLASLLALLGSLLAGGPVAAASYGAVAYASADDATVTQVSADSVPVMATSVQSHATAITNVGSYAFAQANTGGIHLTASANAVLNTPSQMGSAGSWAEARGGFGDQFVLYAPGFLTGFATVNLNISGSLSALSSGVAAPWQGAAGSSRWEASFSIYGQNDGVTWEGNEYRETDQWGTTTGGTAVFGSFPFTMQVVFGETIYLSLSGVAGARAGVATGMLGAAAVEGSGHAALGNTISWGGMVLHDAFGVAITDFSAVSADTGFNYANAYGTVSPVPVPVPEPEIYAMMALGLGLLGWVGRRRKLQAA